MRQLLVVIYATLELVSRFMDGTYPTICLGKTVSSLNIAQ